MKKFTFYLVFICAALYGCSPGNSPEAVLKKAVSAANNGDIETFRELLNGAEDWNLADFMKYYEPVEIEILKSYIAKGHPDCTELYDNEQCWILVNETKNTTGETSKYIYHLVNIPKKGWLLQGWKWSQDDNEWENTEECFERLVKEDIELERDIQENPRRYGKKCKMKSRQNALTRLESQRKVVPIPSKGCSNPKERLFQSNRKVPSISWTKG